MYLIRLCLFIIISTFWNRSRSVTLLDWFTSTLPFPCHLSCSDYFHFLYSLLVVLVTLYVLLEWLIGVVTLNCRCPFNTCPSRTPHSHLLQSAEQCSEESASQMFPTDRARIILKHTLKFGILKNSIENYYYFQKCDWIASQHFTFPRILECKWKRAFNRS